jgi:hypothetical protein
LPFALCLNLPCRATWKSGSATSKGVGAGSGLVASRTSAAAAAFACLVAVPAKHRTIAAWFKWNSGGLAAAGADHRCSMGWSRTIPGASPTLFALLCHTARLAAFGGRITAFLEERLIRSGKRKILSTIAARKLNISGHGCPLSMSSSRLYIRVGKFYIRIFPNPKNLPSSFKRFSGLAHHATTGYSDSATP